MKIKWLRTYLMKDYLHKVTRIQQMLTGLSSSTISWAQVWVAHYVTRGHEWPYWVILSWFWCPYHWNNLCMNCFEMRVRWFSTYVFKRLCFLIWRLNLNTPGQDVDSRTPSPNYIHKIMLRTYRVPLNSSHRAKWWYKGSFFVFNGWSCVSIGGQLWHRLAGYSCISTLYTIKILQHCLHKNENKTVQHSSKAACATYV